MAGRTVTMHGTPLPVLGDELKKGDKAPDFKLHKLTDGGVGDVTLSDFKGKTLILSVVPSLDTPVCEIQTMRFNEEAAKQPENISVLTVSMDLPFAQGRFREEHKAQKVQFGSDHRDASFARAYGTLIEPLRLEARSIFVVNPEGALDYVQYVPEITDQPDYDAALKAARKEA
ncbi:MAG: thiol peroxidase [Armatimonadetes bacterium]|nr:thiol peroxidase [Armatimonadota bacterium]